MDPRGRELTRLLHDWRAGDEAALESLLPLVYDELRSLAQRSLRAERPDHTLQATALVHEAYLRLVDGGASFEGRAHFFGAAARLMRQILVDHARARLAQKRGGGGVRVSLSQAAGVVVDGDQQLVDLDEALAALARLDPQQARLVELRYFAGLSVEETAQVMGSSPATVKRHWATAKLWLKRELERGIREAG